MIAQYATIGFFLVYGISKFTTIKHVPKVLGILALVTAVSLIATY